MGEGVGTGAADVGLSETLGVAGGAETGGDVRTGGADVTGGSVCGELPGTGGAVVPDGGRAEARAPVCDGDTAGVRDAGAVVTVAVGAAPWPGALLLPVPASSTTARSAPTAHTPAAPTSTARLRPRGNPSSAPSGSSGSGTGTGSPRPRPPLPLAALSASRHSAPTRS
ncbi:hypothetical protein [Streptomyces sp. NPDC020983]|uniref:hypothetical protein n=1 Tax=Streptomyces sp. NPDC020983 TaxID=3365106 RepID=UPI0037A290FB